MPGDLITKLTSLLLAPPLNYNIYKFIDNRPLTDHPVPQQAGGLRGAGYNKLVSKSAGLAPCELGAEALRSSQREALVATVT